MYVGRNGYRMLSRNRYEHITVVEKTLGRPLPEGAVVHHVNGDPLDNRPGNLVLCPSQAYHLTIHARERVIDAGGNPNTDKWCSGCRTVHAKSAFSTDPGHGDGFSHKCRAFSNKYRKARGIGRKAA